MLLFMRHGCQALVTQYVSSESPYMENRTGTCACTQTVPFETNSCVAPTVPFLTHTVSRKPLPTTHTQLPRLVLLRAAGPSSAATCDPPAGPQPCPRVSQAGALPDLPSEQTLRSTCGPAPPGTPPDTGSLGPSTGSFNSVESLPAAVCGRRCGACRERG